MARHYPEKLGAALRARHTKLYGFACEDNSGSQSPQYSVSANFSMSDRTGGFTQNLCVRGADTGVWDTCDYLVFSIKFTTATQIQFCNIAYSAIGYHAQLTQLNP